MEKEKNPTKLTLEQKELILIHLSHKEIVDKAETTRQALRKTLDNIVKQINSIEKIIPVYQKQYESSLELVQGLEFEAEEIYKEFGIENGTK